jgi:hypothetical protein
VLDFLSRHSSIAAIIPVFMMVAGFALGYRFQGSSIDRIENEYALYVARAEQQAAQAALARVESENRWKKEKEDAEKDAAARESKIAADLSAAVAAARRLRDANAALQSRLADAPRSAAVDAAAAIGELLGTCTEEYRDMADKADRHASDVRTLTAAWPSSEGRTQRIDDGH